MNTQTLIATLEAAPDIIIGLVREVPPQNSVQMFRHLLMHEMLRAYRTEDLMRKKDW